MFIDFEKDREYLENKYHRADEPFDPYRRMNYHGYEYDPQTGLDDEGIAEGLRAMETTLETMTHTIAKARAVEYVLDNMRIDVNEHDWFVGFYNWNRAIGKVTVRKWEKHMYDELVPEVKEFRERGNETGAVAIWMDFDHVIPDWDSLLSLGFSGIRERARTYRRERKEKQGLTDRERDYFDGIEIQYTAIIRILDRLYHYALTKTHAKAPKIAVCLAHLRDGAPTDTYEALQLIYVYFMISESVDYFQVRSLGNGLDSTLRPFWERDLAAGTYTHDELCELLAYFFMQWSAIGNYWGQPFYMGGTAADGSTLYNALSYDILRVYRSLGIYNPKIQLKVNNNTPTELLNYAFDMVRKNEGNLVFCCELGMMRAVMSYGATLEEARTLDIRGCYETGVRANEVSTGTTYINMLKPVLYALNDGVDERKGIPMGIKTGDAARFSTFEAFYEAVLAQLSHLIESSIDAVNRMERYIDFVNPSSMYSATIKHSLERAVDGYSRGVKYNNSTLLCCGLGSFVDAVMAVKWMVYDKKMTTLTELKAALSANWEGYEGLHRAALSCPHKYGNGDAEADIYAEAIARWFALKVENRPNARGGRYKVDIHSAMQFVWQGQKTGATPDGRRAGEEISKNASPSVGMDKNGVTALISSAVKLNPYLFTEAFCLDVMLHPSAVSGDEGLTVMRALLDTYMKNGGQSLQFNIFDTETLREAQANPEKYKNLQVRVCGWNVLWNNLSRAEQDACIKRAENI